MNLDGALVLSDTQPSPPKILSAPVPTHTVKKWGDAEMIRLMGFDTNLVGSNFQVFPLATVDAFEAVKQFQKLDMQAANLLKFLQYDESPAAPLYAKYNWLCSDGEGRPYWTDGGKFIDGDWDIFQFGTLVFGGQKIAVEIINGVPVEYVMRHKYKAEEGGRHDITFYKLEGLRRDDLPLVYSGKITHATHPHLIQKCTEARANNTYSELPKGGTIYHPVWSPLDWSSNNGKELFVAKVFLL